MGRNESPGRLQDAATTPARRPASPGAEPASAITLHVNGVAHALPVSRDAPLLGVLRNDLGLNGPKYGCGLGQCGACTVLVDGIAARACVIPACGVQGRQITTLEGLGDASHPHPVQQAFIDEQGAQCGYCLNGMIMTTAALLAENPRPSEEQVRQALAGNLCRCGTHVEIMRSVMRAAELMAETKQEAESEDGSFSRAGCPPPSPQPSPALRERGEQP